MERRPLTDREASPRPDGRLELIADRGGRNEGVRPVDPVHASGQAQQGGVDREGIPLVSREVGQTEVKLEISDRLADADRKDAEGVDWQENRERRIRSGGRVVVVA